MLLGTPRCFEISLIDAEPIEAAPMIRSRSLGVNSRLLVLGCRIMKLVGDDVVVVLVSAVRTSLSANCR